MSRQSPPPDRLYLLRVLTATLKAAVAHPSTAGGLVRTPLAMPLLVALTEERGEEVCGAELQKLLALSQAATSRAIARWAELGVLGTYQPADRRKTAVRLTAKGKAMVSEILNVMRDAMAS
jgi:DNA-binding MarR family transcriptional regulator